MNVHGYLAHLSLGPQRHGLAFLVAVSVAWMVYCWQPMAIVDRVWNDILLSAQENPADARIVLLQISAADVLEHGVDRLDRNFLGETYRILARAGVTRVLSDLNFTTHLSESELRALSTGMAELGPKQLGFGYEPDPKLRGPRAILDTGTITELRLIPDVDGRFRAVNYTSPTPGCDPVAWLASGRETQKVTPIDLRVDPLSFTQLYISDLHREDFDPSVLREKLVILSFDETVAKTRVFLPLVGEVNRATILAMGTHSQLTNYPQTANFGQGLTTAILMCGWLAGLLSGWHMRSVRQSSLILLALGVVIVFASSVVVTQVGTPAKPGASLVMSLVGVYSAIAYRLKLPQLVWALMGGDLSPEEAWAWRSHTDSCVPALLFAANGQVKRANSAAISTFGLSDPPKPEESMPIAKQCQPAFGVRAERIVTNESDPRYWDLTWPHAALSIVLLSDVTASVLEQSELKRQLETDPLTQLLNRKGFEDALAEVEQSGRLDYALIFMDMNGFKKVNDEEGHEAGDLLLKHAAERFRSCLRPSDRLARLGGDEFAVLMRGTNGQDPVQALALRLEESLRAPIPLTESVIVKVGVAAGFAAPADESETVAQVLHRADKAMYARKAFLKSNHQSPPAADATSNHAPLQLPLTCGVDNVSLGMSEQGPPSRPS